MGNTDLLDYCAQEQGSSYQMESIQTGGRKILVHEGDFLDALTLEVNSVVQRNSRYLSSLDILIYPSTAPNSIKSTTVEDYIKIPTPFRR